MTAITAAELAALNAQEQDEGSPADTLAENSKIPASAFHTGAPIPTKMLHCGLFKPANRSEARAADVVEFYSVSSGGYIEYEGPELRQDDESVLLEIMKRMAGSYASVTLEFDPKEFCVAIGWAACARNANTDRLQQSISRMRRAGIRYFDNGGMLRWDTGLIAEATYGDDLWEVDVSRKVGRAFGNITYINTNTRRQLSEGISTWLFGLICSNDCSRAFEIAQLHEMSGSTLSPKEFGRAVRKALKAIKEAAGIAAYDDQHVGHFYVTKHRKAA